MEFSKIANFLDLEYQDSFHNISIIDITDDSREVRPGVLYIANPNGEIYIKDALERGASVILSPIPFENERVIHIQDDKEIKTKLAKFFYPSQPKNIYAITGTNGKTSIVHFIRQLLYLLGYQAASIGTLGAVTGFSNYNFTKDSNFLTTPGAINLHKTLHNFKENNIEHLAIEASSHGLNQSRLDNVEIRSAGFTNFTRDHLDYHKTLENYFAAKERLFSQLLQPGGCAILNADIPEFKRLSEICRSRGHRIIDFGYHGKEIKINNISAITHGSNVDFTYFGIQYKLDLEFIGEFQIYNILVAIGMLYDEMGKVNLCDILQNLTHVPGRMEKVDRKDKNIYVDYAHTPDALEKAISMLRKYSNGKIITVFGCGGDRDSSKRSIMGNIASRLSDVVIVTDDNPRTEDPEIIRKEIMRGTKDNAIEISDREKAIYEAINLADKEDIILIAGKGHEKYQIFGTEKIYFDDVYIAKQG